MLKEKVLVINNQKLSTDEVESLKNHIKDDEIILIEHNKNMPLRSEDYINKLNELMVLHKPNKLVGVFPAEVIARLYSKRNLDTVCGRILNKGITLLVKTEDEFHFESFN